MSKKKKNTKNTKISKPENKKKVKILPLIIGTLLCVALVVTIIVISMKSWSQNSVNEELYRNSWVPITANNASGDEVEMSEIYNTNYTSYQGSMSFREDGTFSLWLSPGTPDDGTHTGKYTVLDDASISVKFDDGTETGFDIIHNDDESIAYIVVYYSDYDVYFTKQ